jgi:hypothetical protein
MITGTPDFFTIAILGVVGVLAAIGLTVTVDWIGAAFDELEKDKSDDWNSR